jgi:hypothetical protein
MKVSTMNRRAVRPERFVWSVVAVAITAPVWAHHSFAGYDMTKTLTAEATLKEFRWGAPHSEAVFVIKGPDGKLEKVTVASATPTTYFKQGFNPKDFQVGDKMEITWHPSKSGHTGGILASLKLPDGRAFKDVEIAVGGAFAAGDGARQADKAQ